MFFFSGNFPLSSGRTQNKTQGGGRGAQRACPFYKKMPSEFILGDFVSPKFWLNYRELYIQDLTSLL